MKLSLICTVLNEEKTIGKFIDSISNQTVLPSEVIIVDGGSKDKTLREIDLKVKRYPKLNIKIFVKDGNRSVGRNYAISKSSSEIILSTDSGCILEKNWVKNISKPFLKKETNVVAGYYKGIGKNAFQESLIPYVLVMPEGLKEKDFLPATRSMAIKKSVWKNLGKFNEKLSHNEDFEFAIKIKKSKYKIKFTKDAIVHWIPRKNILDSFKMFFRFALGDIEANIIREKVIYLFLRYMFAAYLITLGFIFRSFLLYLVIFLLFFSYSVWAIFKNYNYVKKLQAFFYLPLLQFASDFAVMSGSTVGFIKKFSVKTIIKLILRNKGITLILSFYAFVILSVIQWGIPGMTHPFAYHMDEWHFSQALRTFFKYGTGSVSGAASIPLYHIVSSLLFLFPFYVFHVVNPFAIKYTLDNLPMQHTLFEVLRLHTLFYGIATILTVYIIFKKYIKFFPLVFILFFVFNPLWISLSNYYKYDIVLNFWIAVTILFILRYSKSQKIGDFIYAGISSSLALATKFTAAPLFILYILSYFIFSKNKNYKRLFIAVFLSIFVFIFVGIPDLVFGKGSYDQLLYSTLINSPKFGLEYVLGTSPWIFLTFKEFPSIFGYVLTLLSYVGVIYWIVLFIKSFFKKTIKQYKIQLFLILGYILFFISVTSFGIDGGGNRALVLLPFIILISAFFVKDLKEKNFLFFNNVNILVVIFLIGISFQLLQSYSWLLVKFSPDPREASSEWIEKNIPLKSEIGIENIPIYQMLPNIILIEYYVTEHDKKYNSKFNYKVIDSKTVDLPEFIIMSNDFDNLSYIKNSPKKQLVSRLNTEGYKKIKTFSSNLKYYGYFSDKIYLVITNIMPVPVSISVYEK